MPLTDRARVALACCINDTLSTLELIAAMNGVGGGSSDVTSVAGRIGDVVLTKADVGLSLVDNTADANKLVSSATQAALDTKATDAGVVHNAGNETIVGTKTFTSTIVGSINGNANTATTATNGVVTTGSYSNPSWITALAGSKITGDISGNTSGTASGLSANIAESQVTNLVSDLALKAPLASPTLTGVPTAPTATGSTNTTQVATTAFVQTAVGSGGAVTSVFSRSGVVIATSGDYTVSQVTGAAPLASPGFTGTVTIGTLTGMVKAATGALSAATEGTDYLSGVSNKLPDRLAFTGTGTPTIATDVTAWNYVDLAATAFRLTLTCKTAPTGNFQVTIKRSGDSGSTFPDTIATVTVGSGTKLVTTTTIANASLAAGDVLRCDIISVNGAADWTAKLSILSRNQ